MSEGGAGTRARESSAAFGAAVAWLTNGILELKRPLAMAGVAVAAYAVMALCDVFSTDTSYWVDRSIAYGLIFSVLILALVTAEGRGLVSGGGPAMQVLGDSSYALYLIHFPLLSALCKPHIRTT